MAAVVDRATGLAGQQLTMLRVLGKAGIIKVYPAHRLLQTAAVLARWGTGPAGGFTAMAILEPDRVGIVDEVGELTFAEMRRRSNALARSLRERGVGPDGGIAVMCRNHRGFVEATIAAAKLGADVVYLNTSFSGPQLVDVLDRENPRLVVHDEEFADVLSGAAGLERVIGWSEDRGPAGREGHVGVTLEELITAGDETDLSAPARSSRIVILTSGTTGSPKGASRGDTGVESGVALLSRLPLRSGWRTHVAAPLFHTWGWAHLALAMLLGSTLVLTRRFDPETCLRTVTEGGCDSLVVIPVMMQRILQLPRETLSSYDLSRVKVVAASGSALPGDLGTAWMDRFGDTLYNVYGSTEVAYATVADPVDLREAPSNGRAAAVRDGGEDPRRGRRRGPPRRVWPDLRGQQHAVRRLHRRRQQGCRGRPHVDRRRRPLRRRRPAPGGGPRRRDDRLRRGERVPPGGRGLPEPA